MQRIHSRNALLKQLPRPLLNAGIYNNRLAGVSQRLLTVLPAQGVGIARGF